MLTLGPAFSALWRRSAVGGDLLVWNGEEEFKGVRLGLEAFALAALIVSLSAALLEAVASALALIDLAGELSSLVVGLERFWEPVSFVLV
jgi:hypothetical protein